MSKKIKPSEGKGELKVFYENQKYSDRFYCDTISYYKRTGQGNTVEPKVRKTRLMKKYANLFNESIALFGQRTANTLTVETEDEDFDDIPF